MNSRAETFAEIAEAERLESHQDKWAAGLVPVPASIVGRGGIYDTTWLTRSEALRLSDAIKMLFLLASEIGLPNFMGSSARDI